VTSYAAGGVEAATRPAIIQRAAALLLLGAATAALLLTVVTPDASTRVAIGLVAASIIASKIVLSRVLRQPGHLGIAVVGATSLIGAVWWQRGVQYWSTWDPQVVWLLAAKYSSSLESDDTLYLSVYPAMRVLFSFTRGVVRITELTGVAPATVILAMGVLSSVLTVLGVMLTLRTSGASQLTVLIAMLAVVVVVGLAPHMGLLYTDMLTVWVPPWVVFILLHSLRTPSFQRRVIWLGGAAVLIGAGWAIKTTPVVLLAGSSLTILFADSLGTLVRRLAVALGVCLMALGVSTSITFLATRTLPHGIDKGVEAQALTYVAAGLKTQEQQYALPCFGCFDAEVSKRSYGYPGPVQNRRALRDIKNHLASSTFGDIALFELKKFTQTWGDGMFFAWLEGEDMKSPTIRESSLGSFPRILGSPSGSWAPLRVVVNQGVWLALLTTAGWKLLRRKPDHLLIFVSGTLMGAILFTLIFQGRGRYAFVFSPLLILAALAPRSSGESIDCRRHS